MYRHEGLLPRRLFLRGGNDHLRLAGLLHRLQRVVVFLLGDVVRVLGRVLHGTFERAANVGGQAVPELLVDDHGVLDHAVIGHREIFLYLEHLLRVEVRRRVLGPVDHSRLQRLVHLRERHLLRYAAERADLGFEHVR